jgi:chitinase
MLALGLTACGGGGGGGGDTTPIDDALELTVVNQSVLEGNSGTTTLQFTVQANQTAAADIAVGYTTADGTATAGEDYVAVTAGSVTIPAGASEATFEVTVNGDTTVEEDETFTLNFTGPGGETASATATIENDDVAPPAAELSIDSPTVTEGNSGTTQLDFTVSLSRADDAAVTVKYATADGSATVADSDYTANSGTLTFAAGETSKTVSVAVAGDLKVENDESLTVTLSDATGDATIATGTGTGTISNDDTAVLSVADVSAAEAAGEVVITVSLDQPATSDVTVEVTTSGGSATAGDDYTALNAQVVTIAAGSTSATVPVTLLDDAVAEPDETFTITLSNASGAVIGTATATGTIENDDTPQLSIAAANSPLAEGDSGSQNMNFTVSLDRVSLTDVSVNYATLDGTASAGSDYSSTASSLTIPAGQQTATIAVPVAGDTVVEAAETFTVNLTGLSGDAEFAVSSAEGVISNDDTVDATAGNATVNEGDDGQTNLVFTVDLASAASVPVKIDWSITAGTATAGDDYVDQTGTLTIAAGQTSGTITVQVHGDSLVEDNETLTLNLAPNGTQANITTASVTGTIANDDAPAISVIGNSVAEGDTGASNQLVFTVSMDQAVNEAVTVQYATIDDTAVAGEDYIGIPTTTLTFAAGETSKTVAVDVIGDETVENDETLSLTLSNQSANAEIATGSALGTITNDDLPLVSIAPASTFEGDIGDASSVDFTVTLSGAANGNVIIDYSTTNGTAISGQDFTGTTSGQTTVSTGLTTGTISIPVSGDLDVEENETFTVTMTAVSANAQLGTATAEGTIVNDDSTTLNDTGVTSCASANDYGLACDSAAVAGFAGQDGQVGRDASIPNNADGKAGFKFVKLDALGAELAAEAASWSCVRDAVTGLVWQAQTSGTYTWYNSSLDPVVEPIAGTSGTDTESYTTTINTSALCGFTDWRLPTVSELLSIADLGKTSAPTIDVNYFPGTAAAPHWTSISPIVPANGSAWIIDFSDAHMSPWAKSNAFAVRLVRSGN